MKKISATITIFFFGIIFLGETSLSWGSDELTGEKKLACEAILCLSSGVRPSECNPSLNYFFGIRRDKPSDTRDARKDFLKKCPDSDAAGMPSLINVLVDYNCSACTVEKLNARSVEVRILTRTRNHRFSFGSNKYLTVRVVDPELPAFCLKYYAAIAGHEYTAYSQYSPQPVYVGYNLGPRYEDDEGKEYYVIYAESSSAQRQIAGTISETNHWEWSK